MKTLPVFETVGRHQSIAKAARELCLTPGAVSMQIKNLENFLGCELFDRQHRSLMLTVEGKLYWTAVCDMLADLARATAQVTGSANEKPLVVSCPRLFLQTAILPRLGEFYAEVPSARIRFVVGTPPGVMSAEVDAHIGVDLEPAPNHRVDPLADGRMSMVCSPAYLAQNPAPKSIGELGDHTILRAAEYVRNWEMLLGAQTEEVFNRARIIDFVNAGLDLSAAREGLGIMAIRLNLARPFLESGELVVVLAGVSVPGQYCLSYHEDVLASAKFRSFRKWLISLHGLAGSGREQTSAKLSGTASGP